MKKILPVVSAALGLALASTVAASDQALLDLLVEKGIVSNIEAEQLKKEAASKPARATVTASSNNIKDLQLRGRIQTQVGYTNVKNDNGSGDYSTLEMRRVRLGMQGTLFQNVRARVEANLVPNDFSMRSAYLQWREYDWAHIKVGFDKPTFGFEENTSSASILTVERTLINNTFAPGPLTGISIDGKKNIFGYSAGVYTDQINRNKDQESRYLYNLSGTVKLDDLLPDNNKLSLRADWLRSNDSNGQFGGSFEDGISVSAHYQLKPFDLRAEYIHLSDYDGDKTNGWYIMPSVYVTEKFQLVARYEQASSDAAQGLRAASRYARRADGGILGGGAERGDAYQALYLGTNYYFAGDAHKVMFGVEFSELETATAGDLKATTVFGAWRMLF